MKNEQFLADKRRKHADYMREYMARNPDKRAIALIKAASYRAKNAEKIAAGKKDWYLRNAEAVKEKSSKWATDNAERKNENARAWRKANPIVDSEHHRRYRESSSHIVAASSMRRIATKLMATPAWINEFFVEEAYALAKLREKTTGIKWHVDHVVPLKSEIVCGLHVEQNFAVIPARENIRKGNRFWPDMPTPLLKFLKHKKEVFE